MTFNSLLYTCRVAWVKLVGIKYHPKEFIVLGWQQDDLPIFGKILAIFASKAHEVYYRIVEYYTRGISRHFHSFVVEKTTTEKFVSDFIEYGPVRATGRDAVLYITLGHTNFINSFSSTARIFFCITIHFFYID